MMRYATCATLILAAAFLGYDSSALPQRPASQPARASTTQPAIKPIELRYGIYLARLDVRATITSDGLLRCVQTLNKSYGGNDIHPKHERIEICQGRLTAAQMAELARLFAGWDSLSSEPFGGVPDGGEVSIRYGDKTVSGGSGVPKQVSDVRVRISEFAAAMPFVEP